MPSMLPYGLVAILCGLGIVACLIYGLCSASKEGDELVEELLCEHYEAAQQQLDDFFVAVDEALDGVKAELDVLEECESIFALEAREPGVRR